MRIERKTQGRVLRLVPITSEKDLPLCTRTCGGTAPRYVAIRLVLSSPPKERRG